MGVNRPMADPPAFVEQHRRACRAKLRLIIDGSRIHGRIWRPSTVSEAASIAVWRGNRMMSTRDATLLVLQTRAAEVFR